jgi:hypothetical protein
VRDPDEVLAGFHHVAEFLPREFGLARDLLAGFRAVIPPQSVDEVGETVSLFERSLDARLRMMVARRVGLPFSEVTKRWSHEDLIAELAWDAMEAAERWARCPRCGVKPDEVMDEWGRPADDSIWKLYLDTCLACGEMERANKDLDKVKVEPGTSWRLMPRKRGDPWRDDGDILRDADPADPPGSGG